MDDTDDTRNLVRYGFLTKAGKNWKAQLKESNQKGSTSFKEIWNKAVDHLTNAELKKYAEEEVGEEAIDQYVPTGFPTPKKRLRLLWETFNLSVEEVYFWIHTYLTQDWGYPHVIKTKDIFTASEHSSFFGTSQQRLGAQQDKVSQFLAVIGKMVKELFQIVRELRIIDERLTYYQNSMGKFVDKDGNYTLKKKPDMPSEITLKGIWIDLVEQGAKNPASVYGMSRELQFTTLPDLFFNSPAMEAEEVEAYVAQLDFNRKVKEVLARKLKTFIRWKETTFEELKNRRTFTLKYLWQHFDIIKMYMSWVRPYLHNIKRMHMDVEKNASADLVGAFEGSMIEVEFLAYVLPFDYEKEGVQNKKYYAAILCHFWHRTRPVMSYQQEYQKGPMHLGRVVLTMRNYIWTKEQIESFLKYREKQDFELMKSISASVEAAMTALGGDLEKYLEQAGRKEYDIQKQEEIKERKTEISGNPFIAAVKGAGDMFKLVIPSKSKPITMSEYEKKQEEDRTKEALSGMWECYKNFKKGHNMIAW